jgi:cell division septation protein DedD
LLAEPLRVSFPRSRERCHSHMEHSMRDLDRLREQDPEERGRQLGVWLVLAMILLGLFGAVFVVWNRASRAKSDEPDPLDQLAAAQSPRARETAGQGNDVKPSLDPTKLTFERNLTGEEDRPEVIAALAAAAREEEELAAQADKDTDNDEADDAPVAIPMVKRVPPASAQIPAGLSVSSAGSKLEKAARHDKLVAAALPKAHNAHTRASSGADGEFILQVMSYEAKDEADAFASALRDRGHEAFVAAGHVEGRSRTYRVRIGPFKSKGAADAYRREFEEKERMNTIVVRRSDDE